MEHFGRGVPLLSTAEADTQLPQVRTVISRRRSCIRQIPSAHGVVVGLELLLEGLAFEVPCTEAPMDLLELVANEPRVRKEAATRDARHAELARANGLEHSGRPQLLDGGAGDVTVIDGEGPRHAVHTHRGPDASQPATGRSARGTQGVVDDVHQIVCDLGTCRFDLSLELALRHDAPVDQPSPHRGALGRNEVTGVRRNLEGYVRQSVGCCRIREQPHESPSSARHTIEQALEELGSLHAHLTVPPQLGRTEAPGVQSVEVHDDAERGPRGSAGGRDEDLPDGVEAACPRRLGLEARFVPRRWSEPGCVPSGR